MRTAFEITGQFEVQKRCKLEAKAKNFPSRKWVIRNLGARKI